jgi:hypothetical protein
LDIYLIHEIIHVAPIVRGIKGGALDLAPWELNNIVYENDVPMSYARIGILKLLSRRLDSDNPVIPLYVCSVKKSLTAKGKSKMVRFCCAQSILTCLLN